ncbi:ECF RNA polymerase sigma factor SigE [Actinomadura rubteroloni]|uniref:ECF RNA polymerase sigma factor SigE n=1 Tax=Actinomadura rubteroloni TaxID=1926885 RepID=A0A2P4UL02_9ACTN|nr:ECF RNA polymerase sigma factor SigE [Actinomadura rubteroloni]
MIALIPSGRAAPPAAGDARIIWSSLSAPEVFTELYDRHAPRIHRYAARRLGADRADDIVADTFLTAFRRRGRYDLTREDAAPWLYGIAANLIGKHHRAEIRMHRAYARTGASPVTESYAERADERVDAAGVRRALAAALAALPARDRDVLLLVAWADLTYEQVAEALSIPVGTVRSRLHRARRDVRAALGGRHPIHEGDDDA